MNLGRGWLAAIRAYVGIEGFQPFFVGSKRINQDGLSCQQPRLAKVILVDQSSAQWPLLCQSVQKLYLAFFRGSFRKYRSFIKDAVQHIQKHRVLIEVFTPESRILVAGEDHVVIAFLNVKNSPATAVAGEFCLCSDSNQKSGRDQARAAVMMAIL